MSKVLLVTGGTGFLGRNLIPLLLKKQNTSIWLLSRSPDLPACLRQFSAEDRVRVVLGDVRNPRIFASNSDRTHLEDCVTAVLHGVASTNFSESHRADTEQTNICGTSHVIEFAGACRHLENFFHISTAYSVNRCHGDVVFEDEPVRLLGQANPYEESKARAEIIVRESGLPWAILRPSIFAGHSVSASTGFDFRMGYGVLIGILYSILAHPEIRTLEGFWKTRARVNGDSSSVALELGEKRLAGFPDVTKNFMFIDDIAGQIASVINSSNTCHKTFQVITKSPLAVGQMLNSIQKALRIRGFHWAGAVPRAKLHDPIERRAARFVTAIYGPYFLRHEPVWDTTNTDQCLTEVGYQRVEMSPEKFDWLMEQYVEHELCDVVRDGIARRLPT